MENMYLFEKKLISILEKSSELKNVEVSDLKFPEWGLLFIFETGEVYKLRLERIIRKENEK